MVPAESLEDLPADSVGLTFRDLKLDQPFEYLLSLSENISLHSVGCWKKARACCLALSIFSFGIP